MLALFLLIGRGVVLRKCADLNFLQIQISLINLKSTNKSKHAPQLHTPESASGIVFVRFTSRVRLLTEVGSREKKNDGQTSQNATLKKTNLRKV